MQEDETPEITTLDYASPRRPSLLDALPRWAGILLTVFVGVFCGYAVFRLVGAFDPTPTTHRIYGMHCMVGQGGTLAMLLEVYRTHVGQYPSSLNELLEPPANPDLAARWQGPYISDPNALRDVWGYQLQYRSPGNHNIAGYDLWSVGPDALDGTDDDIGNWVNDE